MQRIYSHPNAAMVHHAKNVLENHGIAAVVQGEHLAAAAGGVAPVDAWIELWVTDDDRAREAAQIIREATDESAVESAPPWTCASCGEEIEGQFSACWNCGAPRPAELA